VHAAGYETRERHPFAQSAHLEVELPALSFESVNRGRPFGPVAQFITNFVDEAVILPLIFAIALTLALLGWRRGALAWLVVALATLGAMLAFKLAAVACGPHVLRSPSGHTAAAALVLGGVAVVLGRGRGWRAVLLVSLGGALLIGLSRLFLHVHTAAEVMAGAAVGVAGALVLARAAGPPPYPVQVRWLAGVALLVALIFHGANLNAEPLIDGAAFRLAHRLGVCVAEPPLLDPQHLRMLRHPFAL